MLKTKNVRINQFNKEFRTGANELTAKKGPIVLEMLDLLLEYGFDVNARYSDEYLSLLEQFISSFNKNYPAIEALIKYGADINALHP